MEEHTLRVLEFDKIVARLQEQAACSLGREAAGLTCPAADLDVARRKQQETSEARAILQYEGNIPLGGIEDIRSYAERGSIGALLQPTELLSVQNTLMASRRLSAFLVKLRERYPILGDLGSEIQAFEHIEQAISGAISQAGEVMDSASPALARVRSELRTLHARLTERMNSFLQARDYRSIIQEPVITIRNDRYCIPIKSEYRGAFPGIVHDASTSGATVFIEPAAVVEVGNRRKEMAVKEREEVEKVLSKLSGLVGRSADEIQATLNVIALIDCIAARAKLSIAQDATEPILNDSGEIDLLCARHPLLTPPSPPLGKGGQTASPPLDKGGQGGVVPIDVTLGKGFSALLITGPNTGGKTVSLKTIGLLSLMAASGLHVPAAAGTELALFAGIFADIGDEQSIEQSLSTFSSHMNNIVRITREARRSSLVLLDEIGAGTDPAEGAALAKAVLDHLIARGARIVATTHYGELKEFAYLHDGIENACVEFDPETLQPTYRLMIGIPGSSNAFAIASRLGLSESIVQKARSNLASHAEATEELIRRIEESHRVAAEHRRLAERTSLDAEALRRRYQDQLTRLEGARDRVEHKAREKAQSLIDAYTRQLDRTLEQLAVQARDSRRARDLKQKAEKLIDKMEEQLVEPVQRREIKEEPLPAGTELKPGTRVRIAGVDRDGEIVEPPDKGKVVVMVGSMRVSVAIRNLRKPRHESAPEAPTQRAEAEMAFEKAKAFSPELNLRGMRVEPGLAAVEKYLDDATTAGIDRVRIIHGKGTGQMRKAVHEYLKSHPGVGSFEIAEPEEGGSGATVVEMRK